jgi:serine/threonine protein phosphatase PrpC
VAERRFEAPSLLAVRYGAASRAGADPAPPGAPAGTAGPAKANQDTYLAVERPGGGDALLLAVFDGHGAHGGRVSALLAARVGALAGAAGLGRDDAGACAGGLPKPNAGVAWPPAAARAVAGAPTRRPATPPPEAADADALALDAALARANAAVLSSRTIDASLSGSTAAVAALRPAGVSLAHVGDSRVILGAIDDETDTLTARPLTDDHAPTRPDEAARILAARGRIASYSHLGHPVGPLRVWLPTVDAPGLCMTRAIGDTVAAGAGVVARSETGNHAWTPADRYLIVASDGVHEFASDTEIVATVHAVAAAGGGPDAAARALVAAARAAWIADEGGACDDCTAIVAYLEVGGGRDGGATAA